MHLAQIRNAMFPFEILHIEMYMPSISAADTFTTTTIFQTQKKTAKAETVADVSLKTNHKSWRVRLCYFAKG